MWFLIDPMSTIVACLPRHKQQRSSTAEFATTAAEVSVHCLCYHGPLARYVKSRVAHAPGMPRTFSPSPRVSDPDTHHGTCVMHVPWCMRESLNSGFLWSQWRTKRFRHSRHMRNPQFHVYGKRPIASGVQGWQSDSDLRCTHYK